MRIARQENDFSYVDKIRNEIRDYTKAKKNLLRIREDVLECNHGKKLHGKVKLMKLLTETTQGDDFKFDLNGKAERRMTQPKIKTEVNEKDENE